MALATMCLYYVYKHCQCTSKLCKHLQERENKKGTVSLHVALSETVVGLVYLKVKSKTI